MPDCSNRFSFNISDSKTVENERVLPMLRNDGISVPESKWFFFCECRSEARPPSINAQLEAHEESLRYRLRTSDWYNTSGRNKPPCRAGFGRNPGGTTGERGDSFRSFDLKKSVHSSFEKRSHYRRFVSIGSPLPSPTRNGGQQMPQSLNFRFRSNNSVETSDPFSCSDETSSGHPCESINSFSTGNRIQARMR